ncbi:MerR family transcriptional regulator [Planosporangium sp. 12N6]|uniref:MerR family transcriptional regulator n=1 Tax=Planosporangium spinosum TaxID=3402278 RepID=UPI003CEF66FB
MADQLLRIGELASRAGVSPRTVDFYTGLGLLTPARRTGGNYRLYSPDAVERITMIRQLEAHGVSLQDIAAAMRREPAGDAIAGLLTQLTRDLHDLQEVAHNAGPEVHGLLAAITARAHSLITTALEIAASMPPPT